MDRRGTSREHEATKCVQASYEGKQCKNLDVKDKKGGGDGNNLVYEKWYIYIFSKKEAAGNTQVHLNQKLPVITELLCKRLLWRWLSMRFILSLRLDGTYRCVLENTFQKKFGRD